MSQYLLEVGGSTPAPHTAANRGNLWSSYLVLCVNFWVGLYVDILEYAEIVVTDGNFMIIDIEDRSKK